MFRENACFFRSQKQNSERTEAKTTWQKISGFHLAQDMLKGHEIDIANLQETNNKLNDIAEASGYTSINTWRQKHDAWRLRRNFGLSFPTAERLKWST